MKIRLKVDLPISSEHGATAGRVFKVVGDEGGRNGRIWFVGDKGEKCAAFHYECEFLPSVPAKP